MQKFQNRIVGSNQEWIDSDPIPSLREFMNVMGPDYRIIIKSPTAKYEWRTIESPCPTCGRD